MSDWTGRRPVLGIADIIFIGGALGQAVCHTVWSMIGCRFLIGIGVGLASCVAPLYIQELSPTHMRGRMVVLNVVMITFGQVVAYGIDAGFANVSGGWRWMVGLGTVPAGIQLMCLTFLPESPRILIRKGNIEAAHRVLERVYSQATAEQIDLQLQVLRASVQQSIDIANSTTFFERSNSMITVPVNRRALIIGCGMQAFQQLCGFNTLMYYSASLFQEIGFNQPTAVGLIISGTNFVFTLFALKYIDIVGRRRIMVFSAPGMVFGLALASIAFHYMTLHTGGELVNGVSYSRSWSAIQGELFGLEVRGIGTSLSTATNWAGNLLIASTYLSLMAKITPAGAFGFYAGLCLLGWLFCVFCFPETAGLSLEEVQSIFRDGFGIRESQRMRNQKREMKLQQDIKVGRGIHDGHAGV
ncbi:general substrate transporter [Suillus spraguei]|nr:general substrate transporter [Suillus spraguei]